MAQRPAPPRHRDALRRAGDDRARNRCACGSCLASSPCREDVLNGSRRRVSSRVFDASLLGAWSQVPDTRSRGRPPTGGDARARWCWRPRALPARTSARAFVRPGCERARAWRRRPLPVRRSSRLDLRSYLVVQLSSERRVRRAVQERRFRREQESAYGLLLVVSRACVDGMRSQTLARVGGPVGSARGSGIRVAGGVEAWAALERVWFGVDREPFLDAARAGRRCRSRKRRGDPPQFRRTLLGHAVAGR
jgi:hypothetical protein